MLITETVNIKMALEEDRNIFMNAKTEFAKSVLSGIMPTPTEEEKKADEDIRKRIKSLKITLKKRMASQPDSTETADTPLDATEPLQGATNSWTKWTSRTSKHPHGSSNPHGTRSPGRTCSNIRAFSDKALNGK